MTLCLCKIGKKFIFKTLKTDIKQKNYKVIYYLKCHLILLDSYIFLLL